MERTLRLGHDSCACIVVAENEYADEERVGYVPETLTKCLVLLEIAKSRAIFIEYYHRVPPLKLRTDICRCKSLKLMVSFVVFMSEMSISYQVMFSLVLNTRKSQKLQLMKLPNC